MGMIGCLPEGRYADCANGFRIHYIDQGSGKVVVFLHGNPESRSAWDHITAELGSFRCIALDLPGFGDSGLPADYDDSLDAQAEFFAAFVEALGLSDPFILVAHDIGALRRQRFTSHHFRHDRRRAIAHGLATERGIRGA